MSLAPPLIKVANRLIKPFGRTAMLNKVTPGEYLPDSGTSSSSVSYAINVFIGQYSTFESTNNQMIQAGDSPMYSTDAVDKDDTINIGGVEYSITSVASYGVNDASVLYVSNVRRL